MKHEDKVKAIQFIRPDAEFALTGDELDWRDENQTEPTDAEIKAGLVAYKKAQDAELKAKDQAKETAEAKLLAIGLTVEDLKALGF
jgi:hypothetical protein